MVKSLLAPYENRAWAQTNWILARLWKVILRLTLSHVFIKLVIVWSLIVVRLS